MKYTIIYERTVTPRKYESFKMGLSKEYDGDKVPEYHAMKEVTEFIDASVLNHLERLREGRS